MVRDQNRKYLTNHISTSPAGPNENERKANSPKTKVPGGEYTLYRLPGGYFSLPGGYFGLPGGYFSLPGGQTRLLEGYIASREATIASREAKKASREANIQYIASREANIASREAISASREGIFRFAYLGRETLCLSGPRNRPARAAKLLLEKIQLPAAQDKEHA